MLKSIKFYLVLLSLLVFVGGMEVNAQDMDSSSIRQKVESKQFKFVAQTANPMRGRVIQLTSLYDLQVSGDSVIATLPYFGRAYSAPVNPSDNGINFTSVKSDYQSSFMKKRWEVKIRPRDVQTINEMNLTIHPNGRATLQVNSNNRQPISFNGFIAETK